MIKPLFMDDILFTKERIKQLRGELLQMRDSCMEQGAMRESFVLSVSHALLLHLENNTEDQSGNGETKSND
jgi:hypothetical protein